MAKQGEGDGRLARARLTDQAKHLARGDREGDVADDVRTGRADPDLEIGDAQPVLTRHRLAPGVSSSMRADSSGRRSVPIATRANASVKVLVPMVSKAIRAAGTITAHGLSA